MTRLQLAATVHLEEDSRIQEDHRLFEAAIQSTKGQKNHQSPADGEACNRFLGCNFKTAGPWKLDDHHHAGPSLSCCLSSLFSPPGCISTKLATGNDGDEWYHVLDVIVVFAPDLRMHYFRPPEGICRHA